MLAKMNMANKKENRFRIFHVPFITFTAKQSSDKFNNNNNKLLKNGMRSNSTYSIIPISEVTQGAVEVWATLPDEIRQDPSLASFRQEHERIHGKYIYIQTHNLFYD